jgi:peptide/nickel transport system permease protein
VVILVAKPPPAQQLNLPGRGSAAQLPGARAARVFARRHVTALGGVVVAVFAVLAVGGTFITPYDPISQVLLQRLQPPSAAHWMGTDELGRDILSRLLFGAHLTLGIAFAATALGAGLGILVGVISGYYRGRLGALLMRSVDLLLALPSVLLAVTIAASLGNGIGDLVIAIGVAAMPRFARIALGSTLSTRTSDFVEAAQAIGARDQRILALHVLPNIAAPLTVQFTLEFSNSILGAAALSFLGLGVVPPTPEWGSMLSKARSFLEIAPHVAIFPGMAVLLSVLGVNLLGDGLRDALDPHARTLGR